MIAGSSTFRSLRVRNFKLYLYGQLVSNSGSFMQTIAIVWLVLELSHQNGLAVGFAIALQYVPSLVLGVWAGVLADRIDKRKLLIATQVAMTAVAVAFAAVDLTGVVQLWMVYVLIFLFGVAFAFDQSPRQAFVPELVPAADLPNAIGLNSTVTQASRIVGPALAGALIVTFGTGACFIVNALSFVAIIAALVAMRPAEFHRGAPVTRAKGQIREGLHYIWRTPQLRSASLLLIIVGTFAINSPVILPLLAKITFHGDADVYSWMTIATGIGALVGAVVWASWSHARPWVLFATAAGYGTAICVAAAAPTLAICIAVLTVVGAAQIWYLITTSSLVQLVSEPSMRGRVSAVMAVAVVGTTPIGGPMIGWVSEQFGPRWAYAMGGVATILGAIAFSIVYARARRRGGIDQPADRDLVLGVDGEMIPAAIRVGS
jgi:MFS family permease